jgi:hypothetical protein
MSSKKIKKTNGLYGITLTNNIEYICSNCGSNKTYIYIKNNRGSPCWHFHNGNRLCSRCYYRLISTPKRRKGYNDEQKKYLVAFCGIRLSLSFQLPRDICEICGITKGQGMKIHRHHYFYCRILPWSMTISVCNSCHSKITESEKGKVRVKSATRTCLICNRIDNYKKIPHKYENGYTCSSCCHKMRRKMKKSQV